MTRVIEILVDLSGSMNDPFEADSGNHKSKISFSVELLKKQVIPYLSFDSFISLHLFRADTYCELEITTFLDHTIVSEEDLEKEVDSLGTPSGGTPIADAILYSVDRITGKKGEDSKLLIITDGEETCFGDFRAAAKEASRIGVDCKIYIIGVGVLDESGKEELVEIATTSGGHFIHLEESFEVRENELNKEIAKFIEEMNLDTISNLLDNIWQSNRGQDFQLSTFFEKYASLLSIIPGQHISCSPTLLIEFFDPTLDIVHLNDSITYLKRCNNIIRTIIVVLKKWDQNIEEIINEYCVIAKNIGIQDFQIKVFGMPLLKTNYIRGVLNDQSNDSNIVVNIHGDQNEVNIGTIVNNNISPEILEQFSMVISQVQKSSRISEVERNRYIEALTTINSQLLKEKKSRLPESVLRGIIGSITGLDSISTIWVNLKSILDDFIKS
ncbi:MAG: VWA domain-containing protein [Bacteroidetes bacterium]|nr:VWA domain-containing protein [Bacteroidota bacterium]